MSLNLFQYIVPSCAIRVHDQVLGQTFMDYKHFHCRTIQRGEILLLLATTVNPNTKANTRISRQQKIRARTEGSDRYERGWH